MTRETASSGRIYWALQISAWAGITLLNITALGTTSPRMITGFITAGIIALAGTHLLKRLMERRGWHVLGLPGLVGRVLALCVVIDAVLIAVTFSLERAIFPAGDQTPLTGPNLARIFLYWMILLLGWSGLFLIFFYYRRARMAERDTWKLMATVRETELDLLKSQVDPHFMFNSLNGVRALISQDTSRAQEMITRLAGILRYSLNSGKAPTVPLAEEIRTVESYLALEKIRFEERLDYRIRVDDGAGAVAVPPMILQLLVENGIKHGISDRVEGGSVELDASLQEGVLKVTVRNSGSLRPVADGGGVGLENARERLRLLHGDKARLSLDEKEPGVVEAVLEIRP